ncbi:hypothetical protein UT300009_29930 [Paraclostridium bifermentans]
MQLKLVLPLPPSVNEYLGYRVVYIAGRPIAQPFETKKAKDYKKYVNTVVKRELKKQYWDFKGKDKHLDIHLKYYMNKKRKDADNMGKVLFDALMASGVYIDDDILLPKVDNIYIDKYNPRVELCITVSDKMGIFDNEEHFNAFIEENCVKCKKHYYKRHCSIISKALENRIEPQINLEKMICNEKKPM